MVASRFAVFAMTQAPTAHRGNQMNQILRLLGVPVLLVACGSAAFAYVVVMGFLHEGCRFATSPAAASNISRVAGNWAVTHAIFLAVFAVLAMLLRRLLGAARLGTWNAARLVTWLILLAVVSTALASLLYLMGCHGIVPPQLAWTAKVLTITSAVLAMAATATALLGWSVRLGANKRQEHE
ncbi:MAG: hypothetical protein ACK5JT_13960 [Hyphomicrobiaceae bacterium]